MKKSLKIILHACWIICAFTTYYIFKNTLTIIFLSIGMVIVTKILYDFTPEFRSVNANTQKSSDKKKESDEIIKKVEPKFASIMDIRKITEKLKNHYGNYSHFKPLSEDEATKIFQTNKIGEDHYNFDLPKDYIHFLQYSNGFNWQGTYCIFSTLDSSIKNRFVKEIIQDSETINDMDFLLVGNLHWHWLMYVPADRKYWMVDKDDITDEQYNIIAQEKFEHMAEVIKRMDYMAGDGIFESKEL